MHHDPIAQVVAWLALLIAGAKLAGALAEKLKQPSVVGELVFGIALGNLGGGFAARISGDETLDGMARIGLMLLLFEVGLESTIGQMLRVGLPSLAVAVVGVVTPFGLGWAVSAWLLPGASAYTHAFIGATLTATSVGISARVLRDLGRSRTREARVILGAAVIDDVLGLLVLAVMSGIVAAADRGTRLETVALLGVIGRASLFLVGSLLVGALVSPWLFRVAALLPTRGALLTTGLSFCFLLAWLADVVGLAPIVGAFAAGLILEELHERDFVRRGERPLEELVHPLSGILAPLFFVLMGMRTDLHAFTTGSALLLGGAITVVAVLGKLVCAVGTGRTTDRLAVALGMVPRGEVGLVFASEGMRLTIGGKGLIDREVYAAVLIMVLLTTLLTPPLLRARLKRVPGSPAPAGADVPA